MANSKIEIELSPELYVMVHSTKMLLCRVFHCRMHLKDFGCRLKEISIGEDIKCSYFEPKKDKEE